MVVLTPAEILALPMKMDGLRTVTKSPVRQGHYRWGD